MIKNTNAIYEHERFKLEPGDTIICKGIRATIKEISFQEWYHDTGFITEFRDTNGVYRSWKQYLDGGKIIEKQ